MPCQNPRSPPRRQISRERGPLPIPRLLQAPSLPLLLPPRPPADHANSTPAVARRWDVALTTPFSQLPRLFSPVENGKRARGRRGEGGGGCAMKHHYWESPPRVAHVFQDRTNKTSVQPASPRASFPSGSAVVAWVCHVPPLQQPGRLTKKLHPSRPPSFLLWGGFLAWSGKAVEYGARGS